MITNFRKESEKLEALKLALEIFRELDTWRRSKEAKTKDFEELIEKCGSKVQRLIGELIDSF